MQYCIEFNECRLLILEDMSCHGLTQREELPFQRRFGLHSNFNPEIA